MSTNISNKGTVLSTEIPRLGIITVNPDYFVQWLDFKGGIIRDIRLNFTTRKVEVVIEHPDMPEVLPGAEIPLMDTVYAQNEVTNLTRISTLKL